MRWNSLLYRYSHRVEKGCNISISFINTVPETGEFAAIQIACRKGCLSGTGRRRYPDYRLVPAFIHQAEQPFSGENTRNLRAGYFCYKSIYFFHAATCFINNRTKRAGRKRGENLRKQRKITPCFILLLSYFPKSPLRLFCVYRYLEVFYQDNSVRNVFRIFRNY